MNTYRTPCKITLAHDEATGLFFPLTPCCGAAVTGTGAGTTACKACWTTWPDWYGAGGTTTESLEAVMVARGCPIPRQCAEEASYQLTGA